MFVQFPKLRTNAKDIIDTTTPDYCPDANPNKTTSFDAQVETVKSTNPDDLVITVEELHTTSPIVVDTKKVSDGQDT